MTPLIHGALTAWNPQANGPVHALLASGDTIFAGGAFTTVGAEATPHPGLAAFDTLGKVASWESGLKGQVNALAVIGDTLFAGGKFYVVGPPPSQPCLTAFQLNGAPAPWRNPIDTACEIMTLTHSDTVLYAGGSFRGLQFAPRDNLMAFERDGTLTAWNPGADRGVTAMTMADDVIYMTGNFLKIGGATEFDQEAHEEIYKNGEERPRWAAVRTDGSLLPPHERFRSNEDLTNFKVNVLDIVGDSIWVGGSFPVFLGKGARNIAVFPR